MRVGVIDYGVGNLGSVLRALEELRTTPILVSRPSDLRVHDYLILPGVGSFGDCSRLLHSSGWVDAIREETLGYKRPLLGVCLGMQMLADWGEEGADDAKCESRGIGLIPGKVVHLKGLGCAQRVPHVGWNSIRYRGASECLFSGIPDGTDFYFSHSYGFVPDSSENVIAVVDYDIKITAAVRKENVWGTQFHPEKSSRAGFKLLSNFLEAPNC
jgi:glutamine amidotransferase